ncbi:MAG: HlyD family efflux transporter periplasmic adaptor subunit [Oscillospiraceae bacterium]|jgi:hypothetical protein
MQGKWIEKLVASMLVLFLFCYVGFQATRYFDAPVKTETVYAYTVAQTINAQALVFREEMVLSETGSGVQSCLYDDGERVLIGQPVVEYLSSMAVGGNRSRLRQTEWEIAMLKEAQNTSLSHFSNAEALGRDLKQQLSYLVKMSASGRFDDVETLRPALVSLLNKRQIATGKERSFQRRIDSLAKELDSLRSASGQEVNMVVKTPVSGYFAKSIDGLESLLPLDTARTADLEELLELLENPPIFRTQPGSGRIVTSQNWYVAVKVDKYDVQWVREGQTLTLQFENSPGFPATVSRVLTSNEREEAVLVIHCNYVGADTINLRLAPVKLKFSQYTGLRVDTAFLRFQEGERGVYVLENNVVRFKKLNPIYEEAGFLLSAQPVDPYDSTTLRQYDQIITKGTELEDGKIIE